MYPECALQRSDLTLRQLIVLQEHSGMVSNLADDFHAQEFLDAPHAAKGPAEESIQRNFEPPYFEWWSAEREPDGSKTYVGWDKSLSLVERHMQSAGPFDGLLGFSQVGLRLQRINHVLPDV